MIRKKLYILIAAIISTLIITYIVTMSISGNFQKKISEKTINAIYETVGINSVRRIDSILDILSREIKNRRSEEQAGIIKKFFSLYRLFKFEKYTQIITYPDGTLLHIYSTDFPQISMDMQNRPYREIITRFQKLKKKGGGTEFYSYDIDNSPDRMIYVTPIHESSFWYCADINLTEYIKTIENVFTPLSELNTIHHRLTYSISIIIFIFIVFVLLYIGKQITSLEKENNAHRKSLQKTNTLLEIEVNIRKLIEHELKETNRELKFISSHDSLTGIANRRSYDEHLAREWERMAREKKNLSLVMCDIDFFKNYNDAYGHLDGDECLKVVAGIIHKSSRRPADLAARYGGEEFSVILPDTDIEGAKLVAEYIRTGIEQLDIKHYDSPEGRVTVSLGVSSVIPVHGEDPRTLTIKADRALYKAKSNGRNRIEICV